MANYLEVKIEIPEDFKNGIISGVVDELTNRGFFQQTSAKPEPKEMLTRFETAERLSCSLVKLWDITRKGDLKKYKIGGKVLYKYDEVTEFINSNF
ncbi:helix-turn-helix domain-containing protein [Flavobacterium azooxidireducens]|uniref:Helix-turn-helix domain-containing protein n=1 Tax=Flavobacterium azooxidireducens TaxID=1871076 RepID=A0ABY4KAC9_9FLAO|nr:helix-turn-helix domain-containing protein [Flavobacterium azooxidireducens]UPQ77751.1 helix-turn-helix domain-containing protein [Flavobacterium azooxidireducens]